MRPITLLAFHLALLVGCASEENTHIESNDAGNGAIETAESTSFALQEFGLRRQYRIEGTFDSPDDADCYASAISDGRPSISLSGSRGSDFTDFPVTITALDGDTILETQLDASDEPLFSQGGTSWVMCVLANETYDSGGYVLSFNTLAE